MRFFKKKNVNDDQNEESNNLINSKISNFIYKIDKAIKNFRFNVAIALFYEVYKIFKDNINTNINKKTLSDNIILIMKLMIPFAPHLAYECLELQGCNTSNQWPNVVKENTFEQIKFAIQVNGKTRDILEVKKDLNKEEISKIVEEKSKAQKYLMDKKVIKTIFVSNKIINYIV